MNFQKFRPKIENFTTINYRDYFKFCCFPLKMHDHFIPVFCTLIIPAFVISTFLLTVNIIHVRYLLTQLQKIFLRFFGHNPVHNFLRPVFFRLLNFTGINSILKIQNRVQISSNIFLKPVFHFRERVRIKMIS